MRNIRTATILFGALLALPATGLASAHMHEITGTVRTVNATRLQITRWPSGHRMVFVLNPSTEREGIVRAGERVDVRYWDKADRRIATDVIVEHAK